MYRFLRGPLKNIGFPERMLKKIKEGIVFLEK